MEKSSNTNKILVVEDEEANRRALTEELIEQGFVVESAANGEEGLESALRIKPDLILLDILMPKMDGLELLKELRKDSWGKEVPVIFLSKLNPDHEILQKVIATEPSYYLVKQDWTLDDIVIKVKETLRL